jgi:hypothetical protein
MPAKAGRSLDENVFYFHPGLTASATSYLPILSDDGSSASGLLRFIRLQE